MILSTLIAVAAPILGLTGYYLLRDFIAPSVRTAIALAPALAVALVAFATSIDIPGEALVLTGGGLLVLWFSLLGIGQLRKPGPRPEEQKLRLRAGQLIPPIIGAVGLFFIFHALRNESWMPAGVLCVTLTMLLLVSIFLLVVGYRALGAGWWLFKRDADADQASRWIADQLKIKDPVRQSARSAKAQWRTKSVAKVTCKTWPFKGVMSELAEATGPPFFKSFLRVDLDDGQLTITAYGVTGQREDERDPTVEDQIEIRLRTVSGGRSPE
jgi:hypothetical protein